MVGVLYKVKDECTEVTPSIGIDYQLYMMATPVQYIISPLLKNIIAQTDNMLKLGKCYLNIEFDIIYRYLKTKLAV